MFSTYRFDNRENGKSVRLGPWSYLWAGLFGGVYLVVKAGTSGLLRGALVSLLFAAALACLLLVTERFVPRSLQAVVLIVGTLMIFLVQSLKTLSQVRRIYYFRGWKVRRED